MANNFPPGVTGNEYAIAGPDYEDEADVPCPQCLSEDVMKLGFQGVNWLYCNGCQQETTLAHDPGDDPDRKYDEERDRRMLGIDRPDELEE